MRRLLPLWLLVLASPGLLADEIRVWTDLTGKEVRGRYAGLEIQRTETGDSVKVRITLDNGVAAAVPLARLSPADQAFVREQALPALGAAAPASTPPIAPAVASNRPAIPAKTAPPVRLTNREAAQAVLAKVGNAEFIDTPLQDFCQQIGNQFRVSLTIDRKALDDVGVAADTPITLNLNKATLREILTAALKPLELSYRFANGGFEVSSLDAVESQMISLTYRVNDLLGFVPGPGGAVIADTDGLLDLITTNVVPDSWGEVGGPGSATIDPRSLQLVVSNSESVHEKLAEFFKTLRARPRR